MVDERSPPEKPTLGLRLDAERRGEHERGGVHDLEQAFRQLPCGPIRPLEVLHGHDQRPALAERLCPHAVGAPDLLCKVIGREILDGPVALAAVEDLDLLVAVRTGEIAHVLHHAQDGQPGFAVQAERAAGVEQREVLWRRHDQHAVDLDRVDQRLLRLAAARRQVDE